MKYFLVIVYLLISIATEAADRCGEGEIKVELFSSYTCFSGIKSMRLTEKDGAVHFSTSGQSYRDIDKSLYLAGRYKYAANNIDDINYLIKKGLVVNESSSFCGLSVYLMKPVAASAAGALSKIYVKGNVRLELTTFDIELQKDFLKRYCENIVRAQDP